MFLEMCSFIWETPLSRKWVQYFRLQTAYCLPHRPSLQSPTEKRSLRHLDVSPPPSPCLLKSEWNLVHPPAVSLLRYRNLVANDLSWVHNNTAYNRISYNITVVPKTRVGRSYSHTNRYTFPWCWVFTTHLSVKRFVQPSLTPYPMCITIPYSVTLGH